MKDEQKQALSPHHTCHSHYCRRRFAPCTMAAFALSAHGHTYAHPHRDADCGADCNADFRTHRYTIADTHGHTIPHPDGYTNRQTDGHAYSQADINACAHRDADPRACGRQ